jgi:hypothetical protein
VSIANFQQRAWANESGVSWTSLYDPARKIASIRSGTDTYSFGSSVKSVSHQSGDFIQLKNDDGQITNYTTVDATQLKDYHGNYCAVIGKTIKFTTDFTDNDQLDGASILLPCFTYPKTLKNNTDEVAVDDPNWLITMIAADWVQTDVTRSYLRGQFITEANAYMAQMKRDNRGQVRKVTKAAAPRMTRW